MALLHFLNCNKEKWGVTLIACCVDHMLRGKASSEDVVFVSEYCQNNGILFQSEQADVPAYKENHQVGTQEAARACRYKVFEDVMKKYNAGILALGHHGDDQVETMLMQQTRGQMGFYGTGIPVKRAFAGGSIIRPLLTITKQEIEDYCAAENIIPRRDLSNHSDHYTRNRFRKNILPFLKQENPQVHLRFQQESEQRTEDQRLLMALAKEAYNQVVLEETENGIRFSAEKLQKAPLSLQRRIIHLILNYLYLATPGHANHQTVHIDSFIQWLQDDHTTGQFHLPHGLVIRRSYKVCYASFKKAGSSHSYTKTLNIPGRTDFPEGAIVAKVTDAANDDGSSKGKNVCICDYDKLLTPLTVRTRHPGDSMRPKGLGGSQKLKKIFINEKVDPEGRDKWPVVTDSEGGVLWLPGLKYSEKTAINDQTKTFLFLTYISNEELGGLHHEE